MQLLRPKTRSTAVATMGGPAMLYHTSMPSEVLFAIITGASGLVGAVIGASATLLQHSQQVKSERANAIREQSELAARKCESLCNQLAKDITLSATTRQRPGSPDSEALYGRINSTLPEVNAAALYLPEPLRERIREAAEIIYDSDSVAQMHYNHVGTIASVARDEVCAIVAAFVQGKDYPEAKSKMAEYRVALKEYYELLYEESYNDNLDDVTYRNRRERFYTAHPELRPPSVEGNS
ncbi:MAG: hypothetical protein LC775_08730 [Acidobacteria bacterium]|nr:hypothetical protein [Acidobacteriota bacterium]